MKEPACVQVPIRLCYTLGHWSISVNIFLKISFFQMNIRSYHWDKQNAKVVDGGTRTQRYRAANCVGKRKRT